MHQWNIRAPSPLATSAYAHLLTLSHTQTELHSHSITAGTFSLVWLAGSGRLWAQMHVLDPDIWRNLRIEQSIRMRKMEKDNSLLQLLQTNIDSQLEMGSDQYFAGTALPRPPPRCCLLGFVAATRAFTYMEFRHLLKLEAQSPLFRY